MYYYRRHSHSDTILLVIVTLAIVAAATGSSQQRLCIDDPVVYAATERIVRESRQVIRYSLSDVDGAVKRNPYLSTNDSSIQQFIRIGQMRQDNGPSASYSKLQMNAWRLFFAKNPYLIINNTVVGIEVISYTDGSTRGDVDTTVALTEWMITVDKVHILSNGFGGNTLSMGTLAQQHQIPIINSADYSAAARPPTNWTLTLLPNLAADTYGSACVSALVEAGAKTFVIIANDAGSSLKSRYQAGILRVAGNDSLLGVFNITQEMRDDPTKYDEVLFKIRDLQPDVLVGSTTDSTDAEPTMLAFVDRMLRRKIRPNAVVAWVTASYPSYRLNGTWKVAGHMLDEAYAPSLNEFDPVWGSSRKYDADYTAMFGYPSGNNDAGLAAGITALVVGLNNSDVDIEDPYAVMRALTSVNTSSLVGPLYFIGGIAQRRMHCLQDTFPEAVDDPPVWPHNAPAYTRIVYPAVAVYPKGWLKQFAIRKDHTIRNIIIGIFASLGGILLLAAIVAYIINRQYHLIFINKEALEGADEWGN